MSQLKFNKRTQTVSVHIKPYNKLTTCSLSPNSKGSGIKQISDEIERFLKNNHCIQLHLFHMTEVLI